MIAVYTVDGGAHDLEGWTPTTLADALRAPLAELGVAVRCRPNYHGLEGLRIYRGLSLAEEKELAERVKATIERIVIG